jgi:segregation and condensation protein A
MTAHATVRFSELFEAATSRSEVVCTFLALLELIRLKQLVCGQSSDFGEIEIRRREEIAPMSAAPEATAPANPQTPAENSTEATS